MGEAEPAELCVAALEKANREHVLMVIDQAQSDRVASIAEAFKPGAVLLLGMDRMAPLDGAEVCRQLRAGTAGGAKLVLFSSDSLKKGLRAAKACGADAFIRKPFEPEKLVEMLELLLS